MVFRKSMVFRKFMVFHTHVGFKGRGVLKTNMQGVKRLEYPAAPIPRTAITGPLEPGYGVTTAFLRPEYWQCMTIDGVEKARQNCAMQARWWTCNQHPGPNPIRRR